MERVGSEFGAGLLGRWGAYGWVRRSLVVGVAGGVLVGAAVLVSHSPIFSARTITVRGASHLSEPAVLRLAGVQPGTNVLYLDTGAARAGLVADPWVASATVVRRLPSTVEIIIHEVRPVGVTENADAPMLLAQDGTILGPAPAATRLPVIGTVGESSVRDGAVVLGVMPKPLLTRIGALAVAADGSITLTLRDGVLVTYGDARDSGSKAQALRAVLAWARSQPIGIISIDVSSPTVPTARLRGTTAATAIAPPSPVSGSPTPSP